MTKRTAELIVLSVFLVIALALHRSTATFPDSVQGSTAAYVRFLAICLGGLCLLELLLWAKNRPVGAKKMLALTAAPVRFWGILILMFGYAMLLEQVGFYLASSLFLPAAMVLLGSRKTPLITITSGSVLLFVYLVFAKLLSVPLPESTLF
ncbi:MAG: tripartite tricarboxylate transporter TctB family protein [Desulfofustis sp.]|nr:tripartite tricarboxylate transporter TctB family protein [Desulfofustis sp.]